MATRLEVLEASLVKRRAKFDASLGAHIVDVKGANGQPLNDKRDGHVTLNRWERQNDALRAKQEGIEKTKRAIEREQGKIADCAGAMADMPPEIVALVNDGVLIQWRKHPTTFFVDGVDKARIQYKKGRLSHRYSSAIKDKDQWAKFRDTYNGLNKVLG